jgi:hypothetical protein
VKKAVALAFLFLLSGCLLPEARVFQKKVPVEQASPEILEGQRQGADYIEQRSASPGADPIKTIEEIHAVAAPLSASLGEPAKKVTVNDGDAVLASLKKALIAEQKRADEWKKFSQKYGGTQLEGTGIDLAAPGALLGVGTLVALFIFVPGTLSVALFVIRRLRLTLQQTVKSVEEFAAENPEAAASLKARQSSNLDRAEKAIVAQVKKYTKNVPAKN